MPCDSPPPAALLLLLRALALLLALAAGPVARGQSTPGSAPATGAPPPLDLAAADLQRAGATRIPNCGIVTVRSVRCDFRNLNNGLAQIKVAKPTTTVINVLATSATHVPISGNGLRRVLEATFPANSTKPTSYLNAPAVTVTVETPGGGTVSRTARLAPSRERSVRANAYKLQLQRGGDNEGVGGLDTGRCTLFIPASCTEACPDGQADFGSGCVNACPDGKSNFGSGCVGVCPPGQVDAGSGCATPPADTCPTGTCITAFAATFDNAGTCVGSCPDGAFADLVNDRCEAVCPNGTYDNLLDSRAECVATCPTGTITTGGSGGEPGTCVAACNYGSTTCTAGDLCPGGTPVSAECADRAAFNESPCACTALQQLAALSSTLSTQAPWDDLTAQDYCVGVPPQLSPPPSGLYVDCVEVGGVRLPAYISGYDAGLAGALQPSVGDFGSSLTQLKLAENPGLLPPTEIGAITSLEDLGLWGNSFTSLPSEIGALTGLTALDLEKNALPSLPTELAALTSLGSLALGNNGFISLMTDIGALTSLTGLFLSSNNLASLPTEIGSLTELTYLALAYNDLASLPTEIGALAKMTYLPASNNRLTGLPTEIGALTGLLQLYLSDNAITSVPPEIAALTALTALDLEGNQLTGVPPAFRTFNPTGADIPCDLSDNSPGFSCANVGAGTSCCTFRNCGDTATCYQG